MNKGFAFYFRNSFRSSSATIWKNKNILQVTLYFLASLVAKATVIFSAVLFLADVRQAKIVDKNRRFEIPETLKNATKIKPVWTMVLSVIAETFIFLGGTLMIAAMTCVLALIGYAVCSLVQGHVYIIAMFCIPGGFVFLVYALMMCLIFSPTPYIIETHPEIGVYETVKICFNTMKGKGKTTVFLNFLIPTLMEGIIVGICVAGGYYLPILLNGSAVGGYLPVIMAAWCIFSIVLILLLLPMFDLTRKVAQKCLFEDIVTDLKTSTSGINIKMCKGVKFQPSEVKDNLVALFDEAQPDSVPAPDSPARRRLKEQAEKAKKDIKAGMVEKPAAAEAKPAPAPEPPAAPQPEEPASEPVKTASPASEEPEPPAAPQTKEPASEPLTPETPVVEEPVTPEETASEEPAAPQPAEPQETAAEEKPKRNTTSKAQPVEPQETAAEEKPKRKTTAKSQPETPQEAAAEEKPKRKTTAKAQPAEPQEAAAEEKPKRKTTAKSQPAEPQETAAEEKPKRKTTAKSQPAEPQEAAAEEKPKRKTTAKSQPAEPQEAAAEEKPKRKTTAKSQPAEPQEAAAEPKKKTVRKKTSE